MDFLGFSVEFDKVIKTFIWKGTIIQHVNFKEVVGLALPDNKTYLVAVILWYRCKVEQRDQWYRIHSPERDQPIFGNTILGRSSIRNDELFNKRQ